MSNLEGLQPDHEFESAIDRTTLIGEGTSRLVYPVKGRENVVIKESKGPFHHANFVEWTIWHSLLKMGEDILGNEPNEELRHRFATCFSISYSAKFIMMERLEKLEPPYHPTPGMFPEWLNDKKASAFGKTDTGQIKVMDYGLVDFYQVLNPLNKMSF